MDFIAIDVETANADYSSICQLGLVAFSNRRVEDSWETLINPRDYFDGFNVAIHGIDETTVRGAPEFPDIHSIIQQRMHHSVIVSHTPFDRVAVTRACEKHGLEPPDCRWLDSARVVRHAWPQYSLSGYGLANVADDLGIEFMHHDALEDARAAGEILVRAMQQTGLTVEDWLDRIGCHTVSYTALHGDLQATLLGEVVVFTGALSIPRREAATLAASAGCEVAASVTKSTTVLVVGDQDIGRLAGHDKSSKHRRAEELIEKGQPIRILTESDFRRLLELAS